MLYVACVMVGADMVQIESVHREGHLARKSADNNAKAYPGRELRALPVSMARPASVRPKRGDVLGTMSEASGLVVVAATR